MTRFLFKMTWFLFKMTQLLFKMMSYFLKFQFIIKNMIIAVWWLSYNIYLAIYKYQAKHTLDQVWLTKVFRVGVLRKSNAFTINVIKVNCTILYCHILRGSNLQTFFISIFKVLILFGLYPTIVFQIYFFICS